MDKLLYYCNPLINLECKKRNCFMVGGPCMCTPKVKYAVKEHDEPKRCLMTANGPIPFPHGDPQGS